MSAELLFKNVSFPDLCEKFTCSFPAGSTTLVVTSYETECALMTRLFSGLLKPTAGSLLLDGRDLSTFSIDQLHEYRQQNGIATSQGGLISNLKVWENITLPALYCGQIITEELQQSALTYLNKLGYTGNIMALPAHLGLHDKRIVGIVRELLKNPRIIVYSDCFGGISLPNLERFSAVTADFHLQQRDRISIYLSTSDDSQKELNPDTVVHLHGSAEKSRGSHDS